MRLTIRHPRRFPDRGLSMTEDEKNQLFNICLAIIEQDNFLHSVDSIRGFLWLLNHEFQGDAFVYLLSELRYRGPGSITEKAWSEIAQAFKHHPNLVFDAKNPLTRAIRNLTLKSWECWETRVRQQQNKTLNRPEFILQLLEQRTPGSSTIAPNEYSAEGAIMDLDVNATASFTPSASTNWDFGPSSINDPLAPMDWNYWNGLIQDAEHYSYTIDNLASQPQEWSA
jgi:hypothetical protein